MMGLPAGTRIWIAAGFTDMRAGFNGLAAEVETALQEDPYSGHVFVFRGRRGGEELLRKGMHECSPQAGSELAQFRYCGRFPIASFEQRPNVIHAGRLCAIRA